MLAGQLVCQACHDQMEPAPSAIHLTDCCSCCAFCGSQVVSDPKLSKSGVYWSFNNIAGSFENQVSEEVADDRKAAALFEISEKLVGLA